MPSSLAGSPADVTVVDGLAYLAADADCADICDDSSQRVVRAAGWGWVADYLLDVAQSLPGTTGDRSISIVYAAMHGVGGKYVVAALDRFAAGGFRPEPLDDDDPEVRGRPRLRLIDDVHVDVRAHALEEIRVAA